MATLALEKSLLGEELERLSLLEGYFYFDRSATFTGERRREGEEDGHLDPEGMKKERIGQLRGSKWTGEGQEKGSKKRTKKITQCSDLQMGDPKDGKRKSGTFRAPQQLGFGVPREWSTVHRSESRGSWDQIDSGHRKFWSVTSSSLATVGFVPTSKERCLEGVKGAKGHLMDTLALFSHIPLKHAPKSRGHN
uniref:Uncharacterized protein n=1 Tax=Steinernema glaseri TaxID=37863 RepID=A0A1I8ATL4_9BILA